MRTVLIVLICFVQQSIFAQEIIETPRVKDAKIAFVSYRSGSAEIYFMDADGSNLEQITDSPYDNRFPVQIDMRTLGFSQIDSANNFKAMQIDVYTKEVKVQESNPIIPGAEWEQPSPDGRYIAFVKNIEGVNELYLYDTVNKVENQVTRNRRDDIPAHSINHRWSWDGKKIAFMSGPDWYNQFIRVFDLKNGTTKVITERGYMNSGLLWLKDNENLIANIKILNETLYDLYNVNTESGAVTQIAFGINLHPNISPDGNWIVFESQRHKNDGEVYIMLPDGSNQIRLTENPDYNGRCIWFKLK